MKRALFLCLIHALALTLTACTGAPTGVVSSQPASPTGTVSSSVRPTSEGASSASSAKATSSLPAVEPGKLFDVDLAVQSLGLSLKDDVSVCFPADADGYRVDFGPYLVDTATIVRLTTAKVEGEGSVQWIGYQKKSAMAGERAIDGVIPVSKLNDPLYTCMNLPGESNYYESNFSAGPSWGASGSSWNNRVNGFNMTPVDDTFNNILCMGAAFLALDENRQPLLKADDELTLCIGNFYTLYHSTAAGRDWTVAQHTVAPPVSSVNHLYALPWKSDTSRNKHIDASLISVLNDHTEIKLKGSDFMGNGDTIDSFTFHYWDKKAYFSAMGVTGGQIDGFVMAVTLWVKEPAMADKLVATIGADIRFNDEGGKELKGAQLNCSRAYLIPASPRIIVSHSVGPNSTYDAVMDSEKVQKLIGMKK